MNNTLILGSGMTGLAAGYVSNLPVLEARPHPGGICSSYYIRPHSSDRLASPPVDQEAYRFEIGGGHWIFGGDSTILHLIDRLSPIQKYQRKSSVYFHQHHSYIPYPLQNHLSYLPQDLKTKALQEIAHPKSDFQTMEQWLKQYFGKTLCDYFFYPFHNLYTAGLYKTIAPQDAYKSPINLNHVIQGAFQSVSPVGYNTTFIYPQQGLDHLSQQLAQHCQIHYDRRVIKIDINEHIVYCQNGDHYSYQNLISTLPLNTTLDLAGLQTQTPPDPYTSVLVLNLGAVRGTNCPDDHWLYNPDAQSGFHRVGFYSNVDRSFLPVSARSLGNKVSIYIEKAYPGGEQPSETEIQSYAQAVTQELQSWGFIETVEVLDPTWIEVAYTWSWPGSAWKNEALTLLENHHIYPVGRYARWHFQGIADSIKDGLYAGGSFRDLR
jgi:protoporphyrinogen oxidase